MVSVEIMQTAARDQVTAASLESGHRFRRVIGRPSAGFPFAARYVVINLVGVALIAAAWAEDLLYKPFTADHSGMSYLIAAQSPPCRRGTVRRSDSSCPNGRR